MVFIHSHSNLTLMYQCFYRFLGEWVEILFFIIKSISKVSYRLYTWISLCRCFFSLFHLMGPVPSVPSISLSFFVHFSIRDKCVMFLRAQRYVRRWRLGSVRVRSLHQGTMCGYIRRWGRSLCFVSSG